jgi:DNA invertase Pin-like site-specific DNA recombinase
MASLKAGDVVLVTKLDRLGRSTRELLDLIERIGKAGAAFRSLGDPLWDTSSSQGRLLSTLLAAIAEFERDLIRERTGEGRKRAQAKGVKFGRKPKLSEYQRQEAIKRRAAGETLASIAKSYAVDVSMISRLGRSMRLDPRDTMLLVLSYGSLIILIAAMAYVELAGE